MPNPPPPEPMSSHGCETCLLSSETRSGVDASITRPWQVFFEKHQFDNFKLKNSDGWYSLRLLDAFRLFELGCLYLEFQ